MRCGLTRHRCVHTGAVAPCQGRAHGAHTTSADSAAFCCAFVVKSSGLHGAHSGTLPLLSRIVQQRPRGCCLLHLRRGRLSSMRARCCRRSISRAREIFAMFDLLLLVAQGRLFYSEPAALAAGPRPDAQMLAFMHWTAPNGMQQHSPHGAWCLHAVAAMLLSAGEALRPLPHAMPPALQPGGLLLRDRAHHEGCASCRVSRAALAPEHTKEGQVQFCGLQDAASVDITG